ncbi:MAG: isopentenyl diphosphate isomerase/L-lactate dehydrogenase-like FMN-dependent dehydrogenase [Gammaproteobacteria bacterium]|jgi:isopentenyl diphosphate isomerase/L-lactate dehydrogenase-like FMN-dependent dehydrogenase
MKIFSVEDARKMARKRVPKIMFDYVDGAAGDEKSHSLNIERLEQIRLQPRVLINTETRNLSRSLFGRTWSLPFGIAPMGMCNLTWPHADRWLAEAAKKHDIPIVLSTMSSSSIEVTRQRAGDNAWFQLYVGQSIEFADELVDRAEAQGYEVLMLTVDVPQIGPRPREQRNGFKAPLKIGSKLFLDFALHPQWSLSTIAQGVPKLANVEAGGVKKNFARNESRGKVDWAFLDSLRSRWKGPLVVKGVMNAEDAVRIKEAGVDAVYVSNHGGRQLDASPAAIDCLPLIRKAVGPDYTLLFDSGVRNGDAVLKALALGADFVFLGRPYMYGIGAAGESGLHQVIDLLRSQIDIALSQLGRPDINDIDQSVLFKYTE